MCQTDEQPREVLTYSQRFWKIVRIEDDSRLVSPFDWDVRDPQVEDPSKGRSQQNRGAQLTYERKQTVNGGEFGIYVYPSYKEAWSALCDMGTNHALLVCEVPAGQWVVRGTHGSRSTARVQSVQVL